MYRCLTYEQFLWIILVEDQKLQIRWHQTMVMSILALTNGIHIRANTVVEILNFLTNVARSDNAVVCGRLNISHLPMIVYDTSIALAFSCGPCTIS